MSLYKVVAEKIEVNGVEFIKDELLDLDPEQVEVSELLADGSLVLEPTEDDEDALPSEPTLAGEAEPTPEA